MNPEPFADSPAVRWAPTRRWGDAERPQAVEAATPLPAGARLHEFELLGVLGSGGFGTVYLARDAALLRDVAIKEYLPVEFACRSVDGQVRPRSDAEAASYAIGLRSFIQEARLLAGFDHPSLVKVHRFWEGNGTAYMAMPLYRGQTLKEARQAMTAPPDEAMLRALLEPLLSALAVLHDASVCHRDISPDNIVLQPDGVPVLLDFGCARQVVQDRTQALTAVFKPNFAAIEQYGDDPGLRQGAWTDLYALAGVLRYMILGSPPPPAAMRAVKDSMVSLADTGDALPWLSPSFLHAIDWALRLDPEQRPQSVAAWREVFDSPAGAAAEVSAATVERSGEKPSIASAVHQAAPGRSRSWRSASMLGLALTLGVGVWAAAEMRSGAALHAGSLQPGEAATAQDAGPVATSRGAAEKARAELRSASSAARTPAATPSATQMSTSSTTPTTPTTAMATTPPITAPVPTTAVPGRRGATATASRAAPARPSSAPSPERDQSLAVTVPAVNRGAVPKAEPSAARSLPVALPKTPTSAVEHDVAGSVPSPRQVCGPLNFFAMAICMDRRCREPKYRSHAECEAYIRYAEARRQSEGNR